MESVFIEILQKDIEVFRYCIKREIECEESSSIFSDYNFELSSVAAVSKLLKRSINTDLMEAAIGISLTEEVSSYQASKKLLEKIIKNSTPIKMEVV